jgi:hypothetical protein
MEATLRSNIVRWIIAMAIALGTTAVAIIAIDRAVDYYLDGLRAQKPRGRTTPPARLYNPGTHH